MYHIAPAIALAEKTQRCRGRAWWGKTVRHADKRRPHCDTVIFGLKEYSTPQPFIHFGRQQCLSPTHSFLTRLPERVRIQYRNTEGTSAHFLPIVSTAAGYRGSHFRISRLSQSNAGLEPTYLAESDHADVVGDDVNLHALCPDYVQQTCMVEKGRLCRQRFRFSCKCNQHDGQDERFCCAASSMPVRCPYSLSSFREERDNTPGAKTYSSIAGRLKN